MRSRRMEAQSLRVPLRPADSELGGSSMTRRVSVSRSARSRVASSRSDLASCLHRCTLPPRRPSTAASRGTVNDSVGRGAARRRRVTITSIERKTVDTVVTERVGRLRQGAAAARRLRGQGRACRASSRRSCANVVVSVDAQTPLDFSLELGAVSESVEVTGGSARCSRPTAPTSRPPSSPSRSPTCRCSIATSPSSSC